MGSDDGCRGYVLTPSSPSIPGSTVTSLYGTASSISFLPGTSRPLSRRSSPCAQRRRCRIGGRRARQPGLAQIRQAMITSWRRARKALRPRLRLGGTAAKVLDMRGPRIFGISIREGLCRKRGSSAVEIAGLLALAERNAKSADVVADRLQELSPEVAFELGRMGREPTAHSAAEFPAFTSTMRRGTGL